MEKEFGNFWNSLSCDFSIRFNSVLSASMVAEVPRSWAGSVLFEVWPATWAVHGVIWSCMAVTAWVHLTWTEWSPYFWSTTEWNSLYNIMTTFAWLHVVQITCHQIPIWKNEEAETSGGQLMFIRRKYFVSTLFGIHVIFGMYFGAFIFCFGPLVNIFGTPVFAILVLWFRRSDLD